MESGSAWDVAGVTNATKDHTLVRKCEIFSGNTDWMASSGTSEQDSEWIVLEIDDWSFLGSHDTERPVIPGCTDSSACNYNMDATEDAEHVIMLPQDLIVIATFRHYSNC